jgi:hypothetical protein
MNADQIWNSEFQLASFVSRIRTLRFFNLICV